MKPLHRALVVVLLVLVAVAGTTVIAQKGKPQPTPVWSVMLAGANIFGPPEGLVGSGVVTLDVAVYGLPKNPKAIQECNNCTVFRIEVKAPWSPSEPGPFIEFSGVELAAEYNYNNITPNCRFRAFDANGLIQTTNVDPNLPGCAPTFLSHRHPQAPYNRVMLQVKAAGDALAMPVGASLMSKGMVSAQVTGPDCYITPPTDQIHFISLNNPDAPWPNSDGESVTIHRDSATQWTVNIFRATGLLDRTASGPDPKFGACSYDYAIWSYTKPLATTMIWTLK